MFFKAIYNSKSQLISSLVVTLFLLLFGAVILYLVEGSSQPETFVEAFLEQCGCLWQR